MRVVSDVVGNRGDLCFGTREGPILEVPLVALLGECERETILLIAADRAAIFVRKRAVMFRYAFERFPSQVQAIERRVASLQLCHDAQTLRIVIEAAIILHTMVERSLAGMTKWRVPKIV